MKYNSKSSSRVKSNCLIVERIKETYLIAPKIQESLTNQDFISIS